MKMHCPGTKCSGVCDVLTCLYRCPSSIKSRCKEYAAHWKDIQIYSPDQKYIDKYGQPDKIVPIIFRKRQPRKVVA